MSIPQHAVRDVRADDRRAWQALFTAYARTGGVDVDAAHADRLWAWITDPARQTRCLVAETGGRLVGFAHLRPFERPIHGTVGVWVDDLYVAPEARGAGLATALLDAVRAKAGDEGWSVVRWTTRETNEAARRLYDRIAERAPVAVYNLPVRGTAGATRA